MQGRLLRLSYQLDHHYMGPLSVGRWLVLAGLGVVVIGMLPRVHLAPALMVAAGLLAIAVAALLIWGRTRRYYWFRPDPIAGAPPAGAPLRGREHIKIRASGKFFVESKAQFFADLEAIYHTFETREHAIMAFAPRTHFLLAGAPPEDKGMWYIFIRPAQIAAIELGSVAHGGRARPALRITYQGEKKPEVVCLAFESAADQSQTAGDLWYDKARSA